jgi:hypothetical protein
MRALAPAGACCTFARGSGRGWKTVAHVLNSFMGLTERLRFIFGPATRLDADTPVVHKHDEFEQASEEDLSHFVVESDSTGHHYAVRREDLERES